MLERASIGLGRHRETSITMHGPDVEVVLLDHRPFPLGAVEIVTPTTYIAEHPDGRVVLWPGDQRRPVPSGQRYYQRYAIRPDLSDLLACNPTTPFDLTKCNSGSARMQISRKVPREPSTFRPVDRALTEFGGELQ